MSAFRFRKKTEYGLIMVSLLAGGEKDALVSVHEMQEYGLPRSFLVKIARDLIKAGLISAKEGRGGGYYLRKPATSVTLRDVVEALEGPIATSACIVHGVKCPLHEKCPHRRVMQSVTEEITQILGKYKLSDFDLKKVA